MKTQNDVFSSSISEMWFICGYFLWKNTDISPCPSSFRTGSFKCQPAGVDLQGNVEFITSFGDIPYGHLGCHYSVPPGK